MLDIFPWFLFVHIPHHIKRFPMIYHNLYWKGVKHPSPSAPISRSPAREIRKFSRNRLSCRWKNVCQIMLALIYSKILFLRKNIFFLPFSQGWQKGGGGKKKRASVLTYFFLFRRKKELLRQIAGETKKRSRSRYKRRSFKKVSFFLFRLSGKG